MGTLGLAQPPAMPSTAAKPEDVFSRYRPRLEQLQLSPSTLSRPALLEGWVSLLKDIREDVKGPCVHVFKVYEAARSSIRLEEYGRDEAAIHLWVEFANLQT